MLVSKRWRDGVLEVIDTFRVMTLPPRVRRATRDQLPYYIGSMSSRSSSASLKLFQSMTRITGSGRPLVFAAFVLFVVFCVWDAPPLLAARSALCAGSMTVMSRKLPSDVVLLDQFAESASEHERRPEWKELYTLVMVAGHAIFTGRSWDRRSLLDENNWILEDFQKGQVETFLKHIEKGVELAANDSSALLLFSGGQTREAAGPRSEGLTYWMAAEASGWYGHAADGIQNRTLAEEYARDSMENLLFSVCRFNQVVGRYPHNIKVVSFGFKKVRFVDVHRKALRFPAHRFQFYGIDPDGTDGMRGLSAHERSQAMGPFAGDPYGCNTPVLSGKKETRNPYLRYHPYPQGCPELAPLFRHCGRSVFNGPLPWDPRLNPEVQDRER